LCWLVGCGSGGMSRMGPLRTGTSNDNGFDAKFATLAKFREGEQATTTEEADSLRE
jgi:hypothetical protein